MKSRRKIVFSLILALFLVFSLAGCSSTDKPAAPESSGNGTAEPGDNGEQEAIELKLATFFPATHKAVSVNLQSWVDAVEEATNGKVKVTLYPGETLLKAADIYEGVLSGIADIGHCATSYNTGRFPLMQVFALPGIEVKSGKVSSYVAWDMVIEGDYEELKDSKFLLVYGISPGALHTKKPINTVEDLKGIEMRVTAPSADAMTAVGAIPIAMPMSESYEALSKGIVQGALNPSEALEGWRMAEVTDYTTIAPVFYCDFHYITMNYDVWNSLSPDIQQAIEEASRRVHEETACNLWDEIDKSALEFAEKETGQVISTLPDSEIQKLIALFEPLQEKWVQDMESKGLPGREVLDEFKKLTAKYNEMFH